MMIALASCTTLILDQLEKAPTESTVISPVGSLKKLWIVETPAFNAAMPVGARTMHSSLHLLRYSRTTIDLPVPASHIRKTFLPDAWPKLHPPVRTKEQLNLP